MKARPDRVNVRRTAHAMHACRQSGVRTLPASLHAVSPGYVHYRPVYTPSVPGYVHYRASLHAVSPGYVHYRPVYTPSVRGTYTTGQSTRRQSGVRTLPASLHAVSPGYIHYRPVYTPSVRGTYTTGQSTRRQSGVHTLPASLHAVSPGYIHYRPVYTPSVRGTYTTGQSTRRQSGVHTLPASLHAVSPGVHTLPASLHAVSPGYIHYRPVYTPSVRGTYTTGQSTRRQSGGTYTTGQSTRCQSGVHTLSLPASQHAVSPGYIHCQYRPVHTLSVLGTYITGQSIRCQSGVDILPLPASPHLSVRGTYTTTTGQSHTPGCQSGVHTLPLPASPHARLSVRGTYTTTTGQSTRQAVSPGYIHYHYRPVHTPGCQSGVHTLPLPASPHARLSVRGTYTTTTGQSTRQAVSPGYIHYHYRPVHTPGCQSGVHTLPLPASPHAVSPGLEDPVNTLVNLLVSPVDLVSLR